MRIGIFGGTFDPPHLGHLALSQAAWQQLGLGRLLWVLTPDPPHKRGRTISPLRHRLAMVHAALENSPYELSRVDIDRPAPHYALDTVRLLAEANPGTGLVYLMGGDSLNDLPSWHRAPELVLILAGLAVLRRPGQEHDLAALEQVLPGLGARLHFLEAPQSTISASAVRQLAAEGSPVDIIVPAAVARYIRRHRLYRGSR